MNQQNEQDKTPIRGWKQLTGEHAGKMIDPDTMKPIEEEDYDTDPQKNQQIKRELTSETVPDPIQAIEINFEVAGQKISINSKNINELFSDMEKYNHQFSIGAMLARSIFNVFEPNIESSKNEIQKTPVEHLNEETDNQQINAFFVISKHKNTLEKIGLSLIPSTEVANISLMKDGGQANQVQMMINIASKDHFIAFLGELQPSQMEPAGLKHNLEKIISMLSQQILKSYDLLAPNQEAMELFAGMKKIIEEYKRLGMNESILEIEEYYKHGTQGSLREFVAIKQKGLFSPPGKFFGPADWQIDSTPDMLEKRWNEATFILNSVKENPKAIELFEKLSEHLNMCVIHAIKTLDNLTSFEPETIKEYRIILEAAKQKIKELTA